MLYDKHEELFSYQKLILKGKNIQIILTIEIKKRNKTENKEQIEMGSLFFSFSENNFVFMLLKSTR